MSGRQPKRARGPGRGQAREDVVTRLLSVHDLALERLKSALKIFLFVPPLIHDAIESAAKAWKDKAEPNKAHPDNCSCGTARLKALLEGAALKANPPVLQASDDTKAGLIQLVQVVGSGRADMIMSDMILRTAQSRTQQQSPFEITLVSSQEGNTLRSCLFQISQVGAVGPNTRETQTKHWEVRSYRPQRKGALVKALQGE